jgi:16S rRNA (cytosine967-C5)-methyltransferase
VQIGRKLLEAIGAILAAAESKRADAALRETLRDAELSPTEKTTVTHLVFSYHRWIGWLDRSKPLRAQLEVVNDLVEGFEANPGSFRDDELIQRGLPGWAKESIPVTADLVRAFQTPPLLWLRARPGQGTQLASELGDAEVHKHVPDAVSYAGHDDLFRGAAFHAGKFEVQDLSSQAVGHICSPVPTETWWDTCAGEGGKTLHLCDLMQNKGLVWASDPAEWRLTQLKRRASRAKLFNYRVKPWAQKDQLPVKTKFDGVLVDAPCSGVGTWGRNPHARWTTTQKDIAELAELQQGLLDKIAGSVKPGGRLFYSVCTITRAETSDIARRFNETHPEFEPLVVANPIQPSQSAPEITLLPQRIRANGMYVAAWRRRV